MKEKFQIAQTQNELKLLLEDRNIIRLKVKNVNLCLSFNHDRWVAFEEGCPHLGVSLAGGNITPFDEVVCSWHGYRFNLFDGREAEHRCRDLKLYKVMVEEQGVFIYI